MFWEFTEVELVFADAMEEFDASDSDCTRELAVLVVDHLDPGAIHRQQLQAEQIQLAEKQHKLKRKIFKRPLLFKDFWYLKNYCRRE
jgi:hypothetical protein